MARHYFNESNPRSFSHPHRRQLAQTRPRCDNSDSDVTVSRASRPRTYHSISLPFVITAAFFASFLSPLGLEQRNSVLSVIMQLCVARATISLMSRTARISASPSYSPPIDTDNTLHDCRYTDVYKTPATSSWGDCPIDRSLLCVRMPFACAV